MEYKDIYINWVDLFYYLKKKILIIISAGLLCAIAGFAATALFMKPEYTAATRIYVLNRASENAVSYSDYYSSNYIVQDYAVLITGKNVTSKVVEKLGLNMSASELASKITVSSVNATRVVQIQVVDTNPHRAADIANCVREVASQQIKEILNVEAVNMVYEAEIPKGKSGPNVLSNTMFATVIGLAVAVCALALAFFMDDTIRTEDDVEHYLGLSVLGVIPASSDMALMTASYPESAKMKLERTKKV